MGSVAAILARNGSASVGRVDRALEAAPHRGDRRATLVHGATALGISTSDDPVDAWTSHDGDLSVAFTGRLDNLEALAVEERSNESPVVVDPAAAVATLFRRLGEEAASRLRGTFAAIVSDGSRLWCFRDQLGYRTLFHRVDAAGATVATEAKQVVAGAGIPREPDLEALEQIFFNSYGDETPSALRGVSRLPKGTLFTIDHGRAAARRYWRPEDLLETGRYGPDEIQDRFDALMTQATSRTLTGPDAVALSGGVDSPAIAAYAAPEHERRFGEPLAALTAVFPNQPSVDELSYVRIVADALRMPLHTYERTSAPLEDLQRWIELFDGPIPVFFWTDAQSHYQAARDLGIRNVLNGAVAELVFDMRRYLLAHLIRAGRARAALAEIRLQLARGRGTIPIAKQVSSAFLPVWAYRAYLRRVPPKRGTRVPAWIDLMKANQGLLRGVVPARDRWRRNQLGGFIGPGLSVEANELVQEVCGVRARYPWADVDLWEFFLSLPADVKFPELGSKALVRRLLRGRVPDAILDRKDKTVFNESIVARADYEHLRTWLVDPPDRLPGVDYGLLRDRIGAGDMGVFEYVWAKDLAAVHAFLGLWS